MAFDLSAIANATSGYLQGQQTATQNQVNNQFNQLALGEQQLKYQQDQLSAKNQQALSDDAMRSFSSTGGIKVPGMQQSGPTNPVPPAGMPGGTPQDNSPTAGMDTAQKMDYLANNAAARGDLVSANELWTNATNTRNSQIGAQEKQSAMQTAELTRQQKHYALAAQAAAMVDDTPEGFMQWKMQMLADPSSTPQERQNLSDMQYQPGIMSKIQQRGMTSSQQAMDQLRRQQEQDRLAKEGADEERKDRDEARKNAHEDAYEKHLATQTKVGATAKAPTTADFKSAVPIIANTLGMKEDDESLNTSDPTDPKKFSQATPAVVSIVSRAKQIAESNKAITYPEAVAQAASEAKANGEITIKTVKGGMFGSDKTSTTFSQKGTKVAPLPLPKNKSDLIPGKYYVGANGQVEQWSGK